MKTRIKPYIGMMIAYLIVLAVLLGPGPARSDEISSGVIGEEGVSLITVTEGSVSITTGVIGDEPVNIVTQGDESFNVRLRIQQDQLELPTDPAEFPDYDLITVDDL